jgi:cell division inhibitor SulA
MFWLKLLWDMFKLVTYLLYTEDFPNRTMLVLTMLRTLGFNHKTITIKLPPLKYLTNKWVKSDESICEWNTHLSQSWEKKV